MTKLSRLFCNGQHLYCLVRLNPASKNLTPQHSPGRWSTATGNASARQSPLARDEGLEQAHSAVTRSTGSFWLKARFVSFGMLGASGFAPYPATFSCQTKRPG